MTAPAKDAARVVVPKPLSRPRRILASFIYFLIRCVAGTLRKKLINDAGLLADNPKHQVIFAIWHNRLALSLMIYRVFVQPHNPARRLAALVSASRDGAVVARILEHFGVEPVRGSSSRRGAQALLELTTCASQGHDLAITPDGPRGPCYRVQEGVISLAQLTGLPIIPAAYHLNWKIRLRSWDRFQVPLPFAK